MSFTQLSEMKGFSMKAYIYIEGCYCMCKHDYITRLYWGGHYDRMPETTTSLCIWNLANDSARSRAPDIGCVPQDTCQYCLMMTMMTIMAVFLWQWNIWPFNSAVIHRTIHPLIHSSTHSAIRPFHREQDHPDICYNCIQVALLSGITVAYHQIFGDFRDSRIGWFHSTGYVPLITNQYLHNPPLPGNCFVSFFPTENEKIKILR